MILFRNILAAADFSEQSRSAFRVACALAEENKTRLFVLHVAEQPLAHGVLGMLIPHPAGDSPYHQALTQQLHQDYAPQRPIDVEYRVCDAAVADEILRAAEELRCDLIVMGTHGRSGLGRVLMGSVAEAVLRGSRCPVLMVKGPIHTTGTVVSTAVRANASN